MAAKWYIATLWKWAVLFVSARDWFRELSSASAPQLMKASSTSESKNSKNACYCWAIKRKTVNWNYFNILYSSQFGSVKFRSLYLHHEVFLSLHSRHDHSIHHGHWPKLFVKFNMIRQENPDAETNPRSPKTPSKPSCQPSITHLSLMLMPHLLQRPAVLRIDLLQLGASHRQFVRDAVELGPVVFRLRVQLVQFIRHRLLSLLAHLLPQPLKLHVARNLQNINVKAQFI